MDFQISKETLRQLKRLSRLWGEDIDSILSRCVEWTSNTHPYRNGLARGGEAAADGSENVIQVAEYLEQRAAVSQRFIDKLDKDFEKWIATRRGRKPYSPGAMQLDVDAIRRAAATLQGIASSKQVKAEKEPLC